VIAVGLTFFCASANAQAKEKKMNEALTINGDGAQRNPDIHWPKGQHPEDADLYAHNEIMVNASCETVFANIVVQLLLKPHDLLKFAIEGGFSRWTQLNFVKATLRSRKRS
jgi:hypothetical protein